MQFGIEPSSTAAGPAIGVLAYTTQSWRRSASPLDALALPS